MGLEEAELADALGGDARGGEVSDAAGAELDADVADVGFAGKDGQADGVHAGDRRVGEGEDDVEVVDHEVEDDVDVEGARREDGKPVRFKKHRAAEQRREGLHGRVETLEMADHEGAAVLAGKAEKVVGLRESGSDGLLDQDVDAVGEEPGGDGVVGGGRDADAGGIDVELAAGEGGEQDVDGGEDRNGVGRGCFSKRVSGAGRVCGRSACFGLAKDGDTGRGESGQRGLIGVDDGGEPNGSARPGEFAVDADVVTAEGARAAHSDVLDQRTGSAAGRGRVPGHGWSKACSG